MATWNGPSCSPSYTSSILPVMEGIIPTRSLIQTCVFFSLFTIARRSAELIAFSNAEILSLADTPLFLSTYSLARASKETCSISLFSRSLICTTVFLFFRQFCFLLSYCQRSFNCFWIMRKDLAFDPVFQWSYDRATIRIVFGVSSEYKQNIQRHSQFKTANLYIAFFQDIEQCNLDSCLQIRISLITKMPRLLLGIMP